MTSRRRAPPPIHNPRIVYIGGIEFPDDPDFTPGFSHDCQADIVATAGGELHFYPSPFNKNAATTWSRLEALRDKTPSMHIHKGREPDRELIRELSAFDYGWFVVRPNPKTTLPSRPRISVGAKIFVYLAAGLPVIVNRHLAFAASYVESHGVGIVIDELSPEELRTELLAVDYTALRQRVLAIRPQMTVEAHIDELELLFGELVKPHASRTCRDNHLTGSS